MKAREESSSRPDRPSRVHLDRSISSRGEQSSSNRASSRAKCGGWCADRLADPHLRFAGKVGCSQWSSSWRKRASGRSASGLVRPPLFLRAGVRFGYATGQTIDANVTVWGVKPWGKTMDEDPCRVVPSHRESCRRLVCSKSAPGRRLGIMNKPERWKEGSGAKPTWEALSHGGPTTPCEPRLPGWNPGMSPESNCG